MTMVKGPIGLTTIGVFVYSQPIVSTVSMVTWSHMLQHPFITPGNSMLAHSVWVRGPAQLAGNPECVLAARH